MGHAAWKRGQGGNLGFCGIPWPSFENSLGVGDITRDRVLVLVSHPLRERIPGHGGGLAKSLRSEMLRWYPDRFGAKTPGMVVECDHEAVREATKHVARILIALGDEMR